MADIIDFYTRKEFHKYFKNPEILKGIGSSSREYLECVCPYCGTERKNTPVNLIKRGFRCNVCDVKLSYPEKFMATLLRMNNIKFETQKRFKDCRNKSELPFDFYIPEKNLIIETHGEQHYEYRKEARYCSKSTFINDKIKVKYCKDNGIQLIVVDCRQSEFYYIHNSIKNSPLSFLLENINENILKTEIIESHKYKNIKEIISDYKKGVSFLQLENKYNINRKTICSLMKKAGVYAPRGGSKNNGKKVICLNNLKVYDTTTEAAHDVGLKRGSNISAVCNGYRKYSGMINGEYLKWQYYIDYINEQEQENHEVS